jgi:hypothetical protein
MKFKFVLGLLVALAICSGGAAFAESKKAYMGYVYPFEGRDLKQELGTGPIIVELFSTQACVYCPVADQFFNDLVTKAPVIGIACHVDYFDVKEGALSIPGCSARQFTYAGDIPGNTTYTPQMIINGRKAIVAYRYDEVLREMATEAKTLPKKLDVKLTKEGNHLTGSVTVPTFDLGKVPETDEPILGRVTVLQIRKPMTRKISEGVNKDIEVSYLRTVSVADEIKADWDGKETQMTFDVSPDKDSDQIVVLVQAAPQGILAVGTAGF